MVDDVRDVESALGGIKREISDRERAKRRAIYAIVDINPVIFLPLRIQNHLDLLMAYRLFIMNRC